MKQRFPQTVFFPFCSFPHGASQRKRRMSYDSRGGSETYSITPHTVYSQKNRWMALDFPDLTSSSIHLLDVTHFVNSPNSFGQSKKKKRSSKTYSANTSVLNWLQVGLSSSSSLNPHHSHPESHYTSNPSDNPIRLNFILQLYALCSWCFTNYYISGLLGISVRNYSTLIYQHTHICKRFISVFALLFLFFIILPSGQNKNKCICTHSFP